MSQPQSLHRTILVRNGPEQRTDTSMLLLVWPYYVLANPIYLS